MNHVGLFTSSCRLVQMGKNGQDIVLYEMSKSGVNVAKEQIPLSQITQVLEGKGTSNLKKTSHEFSKCFAIVTEKDTFEFAAESTELREKWCESLKLYLLLKKTPDPKSLQKQAHEKYQSAVMSEEKLKEKKKEKSKDNK